MKAVDEHVEMDAAADEGARAAEAQDFGPAHLQHARRRRRRRRRRRPVGGGGGGAVGGGGGEVGGAAGAAGVALLVEDGGGLGGEGDVGDDLVARRRRRARRAVEKCLAAGGALGGAVGGAQRGGEQLRLDAALAFNEVGALVEGQRLPEEALRPHAAAPVEVGPAQLGRRRVGHPQLRFDDELPPLPRLPTKRVERRQRTLRPLHRAQPVPASHQRQLGRDALRRRHRRRLGARPPILARGPADVARARQPLQHAIAPAHLQRGWWRGRG